LSVVVDTGPLVALFNRRDAYHEWTVEQFGRLRPPLFSCEAVLAEVHHLLSPIAKGRSSVAQLVESNRLDLTFSFATHSLRVHRLMEKYDDVPMSFADACLVVLAETVERPVVFTIDSDFTLYRMSRNRRLKLVLPASRR